MHAVQAVTPGVAAAYEVDLAEHAQVLRDLGLIAAESLDELAHGGLAGGQCVEQLPSRIVADGVEHVGGGGGPGHGRDSMLISAYVKSGAELTRDRVDPGSS